MYLMRTMTDTALKGIGAVLGGKDHSTVKYGVTSLLLSEEIISFNASAVKYGVEKIAKDIE